MKSSRIKNLFTTVFCVCIVFLESCNPNKENPDISFISPVDSLSVHLGIPVFAKYYDNKLFIMDVYGKNGLIQVVDIDKDSILFSFAQKGVGPGEYQHISNIDIYDDNSNTILGILDPITKTYRQYSYDSLLINKSESKSLKHFRLETDITLTDFYKMDSIYVGTGITDKGKFVLFSDSFTNERYQGYYRPKPHKSIPDILHVRANLGRTFISPDRKTIANTVYIAGTLDVFEILDNGNIRHKGEHVINEIDYSIEGDAFRNNNVIGYLSGDITKKFIYALYSGEKEDQNEIATYGRQIHVFNYSGKLIKKYDIQKHVFGITIDKEKNRLYAIAHIPEPKVFVYQLDE
jgi:hypothetical protein